MRSKSFLNYFDLYQQKMLGGQVCYLPNEKDCFLYWAFLLIGQVTKLPSQHLLPAR